MRCDFQTSWEVSHSPPVSIPIGFSNALRQMQPQTHLKCLLCFNPYWVFQCAATWHIIRSVYSDCEFQSLLGFPMRCDCAGAGSSFLWTLFQSLLGFPMRCDTASRRWAFLEGWSFNPYWVFQCAATKMLDGGYVDINEFQSLLGFPMRCDLAQHWKIIDSWILFQSLLGFPMRCDLFQADNLYY